MCLGPPFPRGSCSLRSPESSWTDLSSLWPPGHLLPPPLGPRDVGTSQSFWGLCGISTEVEASPLISWVGKLRLREAVCLAQGPQLGITGSFMFPRVPALLSSLRAHFLCLLVQASCCPFRHIIPAVGLSLPHFGSWSLEYRQADCVHICFTPFPSSVPGMAVGWGGLGSSPDPKETLSPDG